MRLNAGKDYHFLVYGPFCWGIGKTEKEAMEKAKKQTGNREALKKNHGVYLVPPDAWVDDMGGIRWKAVEGFPDNYILIKATVNGKLIAPEDVK